MDIAVAPSNDAPEILDAGNLQGVIYGYAKASNVNGRAQYWMPIFTPGSRGYGQDGIYSLSLTQPLKDANGNVLTGMDYFHGKFVTRDVDGDAPVFTSNAVTNAVVGLQTDQWQHPRSMAANQACWRIAA